MKPIVKALILILICISVTLMGCGIKEYSENKELGFDKDIIKEIDLKSNTITGFKDELEDFKSFRGKFFPIWLDHINSTSSMLEDFNNSSIFEEKAMYSLQLEQSYIEFKVNLETLEPPAVALKAYNLVIEAVSYRVLFFKKFNENAPAKELREIENKAYLTEASFWEEIDNVYIYFEKEMERLENEESNIDNSI